MKRPILILAVALVATPALAQDEAKARAGLDRFLKDALGPGDKLDRIQRDPGMELMNKGSIAFTRMGEFTAAVDSKTGDVTYYSAFKPLLYVFSKDAAGTVRTAEDRAAEIARRARFTLEQDVKRARDFLAAHYPDFKKRNFELVQKERVDRDALVMDDLVFVERARDGIVACWPNRVDFSVNPENGAVVTYMADTKRIETKTKPKLGQADARKAALARYGEKLSPAHRDFVAGKAPVDLIAVEGAGGPRTAWLVANWIVVDAETGAVSLRGEKK